MYIRTGSTQLHVLTSPTDIHVYVVHVQEWYMYITGGRTHKKYETCKKKPQIQSSHHQYCDINPVSKLKNSHTCTCSSHNKTMPVSQGTTIIIHVQFKFNCKEPHHQNLSLPLGGKDREGERARGGGGEGGATYIIYISASGGGSLLTHKTNEVTKLTMKQQNTTCIYSSYQHFFYRLCIKMYLQKENTSLTNIITYSWHAKAHSIQIPFIILIIIYIHDTSIYVNHYECTS